MKSLVLTTPGTFQWQERETPIAGANQVLVKIAAVGICQTDIDIYEGKRNDLGWELPKVIGHEISGTVSAIGLEVKGFQIDQPVVIDPIVTCGGCWHCRHGLLCSDIRLLGGRINGGLQEYVAVSSDNVIPIPETLPLEEAAIIEPLACVLTAYQKVRIQPGQTVAIIGPGFGGLCFTQLAKNDGARIILIGTKENRLSLGQKLGADVIVNIKSQDPVQTVLSETDGVGADVVFEASGNQKSIHNSLLMARASGSIVAYGIPLELIDRFDLQNLIMKDLALYSGVGPWQTFAESAELISAGKVRLAELLTHRFGMEDIEKAIHISKHREDGIIKAIVKW